MDPCLIHNKFQLTKKTDGIFLQSSLLKASILTPVLKVYIFSFQICHDSDILWWPTWHSLHGLSSVSWNCYFGCCLKHPSYGCSNIFLILKVTWWLKKKIIFYAETIILLTIDIWFYKMQMLVILPCSTQMFWLWSC